MTSHSLNANCEADKDKYVLQNLHILFDKKINTKGISDPDSNNIGNPGKSVEHEQPQDCENKIYFKSMSTSTLKNETDRQIEFAEDEAQNCISGNICQQLLKKNKCAACFASITLITNKKEKCTQHDIMRKQCQLMI